MVTDRDLQASGFKEPFLPKNNGPHRSCEEPQPFLMFSPGLVPIQICFSPCLNLVETWFKPGSDLFKPGLVQFTVNMGTNPELNQI